MRVKLQQLMLYFISQISEVIAWAMIGRHNIIAQDLFNITNDKLGFIFDYRVCNVPDFFQFLMYYCHQIVNLQFINGTFVAFPKHMGYLGYPFPSSPSSHHQNLFYPQHSNYFNANTPNMNPYYNQQPYLPYNYMTNPNTNPYPPSHLNIQYSSSHTMNYHHPQQNYHEQSRSPYAYTNTGKFPPPAISPSQLPYTNNPFPPNNHPSEISTPKFNESV